MSFRIEHVQTLKGLIEYFKGLKEKGHTFSIPVYHEEYDRTPEDLSPERAAAFAHDFIPISADSETETVTVVRLRDKKLESIVGKTIESYAMPSVFEIKFGY